MGLDITAYKQLKALRPATAEELSGDEEASDGEVLLHFTEASRGDGLDETTVYEEADSIGFGAESYGHYSMWRNDLAKLAGYPSAKYVWENVRQGPFYELIHFSDCEGVIGPVTSAKLAKDFEAFQGKANAFENSEDSSWFRDKYADWRKAFEMAADGGAVMFH